LQDEVFHVVQAQQYCAGRFEVWDTKITTPPGLYLLSLLPAKIAGFLQQQLARLGFDSKIQYTGCGLLGLRIINAVGLLLIMFLIRNAYRARLPKGYDQKTSLFDHSALNIALFPPLFFFAALYYTDVWSTAFVLLFYAILPNAYREDSKRWQNYIKLLLVGTASLFFRQTNIFWAAIFPAGIVLVQHLDRGHQAVRSSAGRRAGGFGDNLYNVAKTSFRFDVIYDVPVRDAWLEGEPVEPRYPAVALLTNP
jgi:alpha-1,2-glucosyltransferase